ncbi:ubiquinone-dependent pyruvate dehydrogenase [Veillonella sp. AS16]|uniref:ubiquinone-dependent pyruvate dehydrogenase n=1 Tax=Veillonella sp. AS16 TaxID=936589 RepID=UPI0003E21D8F|nr:ubiquinone-dependent pyruvate dehydrogenase [Veillonella sp. AS16]ETS93699.1 thiamine pyrophosphate enzyme, N-terminal TPP binding domain protein [Veillonella sp. AS16]
MAKKRISDVLIEVLADAGIERIYGITGDSLNSVNDSLRRNGKIAFEHVRHEETAAFAAGAEAGLTGKLTVCAGSSGPGNLHLINGLFDCHRNRVPVLAIASHIPQSEVGLSYFQETHPENLFKECSCFCELVSSPKQMPEILFRAMNAAVGNQDVAVIVLPGDIAVMEMEVDKLPVWHHPKLPHIIPQRSDIEEMTAHLESGKRITLFCGAGCEGAHDEVVELAKRLQAPVVHAFRGKEWVEWDNPYDVGMTGLLGYTSGYRAIEQCDTLVMLGTDFPYRPFYPENAKVIQIDRDPGALGRRVPLTQGIIGNVKDTLKELLPLISQRDDTEFIDTIRKAYKKFRSDLDSYAVAELDGVAIHPQYFVNRLNTLAAEDAIFTFDVGTPVIWTARHLKTNGKRRILGSFNHGSMANAMMHAIGAQNACPNRQVISLSGDGGFTMMMGEMLTLKQLNLPVKVFVFNNEELSFIAMEMKASGYLDYATDFVNPDFGNLAEAAGIKGISIENSSEVDEKIKEALNHNGPVIINVRVDKQELAMPPKIAYQQAKGFSKYLINAILDGRGTELKEMAKTNWMKYKSLY